MAGQSTMVLLVAIAQLCSFFAICVHGDLVVQIPFLGDVDIPINFREVDPLLFFDLVRKPERPKMSSEFLWLHNLVRARFNEPPLSWSPALARFARRYANQRRADCELVHSQSEYGENLFWGSGSAWRPYHAVKVWLEEYEYCNPSDNSCRPDKECGHYTQLVWNETQRVGCARVVCRNGDTFVTCNYDPPGNYIGESPFQ